MISTRLLMMAGLVALSISGSCGGAVDGGALASTSSRVTGFAADVAGIAWVESADDEAMTSTIKYRSAEGPTMTVTTSKAVFGLAMDASHLYWVSEHRVQRAARGSSTVEPIATIEDEVTNPAIDDRHVYWVANGRLCRAPKQGGAIETLPSPDNAMNLDRVLVVDGVVVVAANQSSPEAHLALWTLGDDGTPKPLATSKGLLDNLVGGEGRVAWTGTDKNERWSLVVSVSGGTPMPIENVTRRVVAVDAESTYWASDDGIQRTDAHGTRRFCDRATQLALAGKRAYGVFPIDGKDRTELRSLAR